MTDNDFWIGATIEDIENVANELVARRTNRPAPVKRELNTLQLLIIYYFAWHVGLIVYAVARL